VLAALPFELPKVLPPKRANDERITLVLDLDETLVHCSMDETTIFDWKFDVDFHGTNYAVSVRTRPHLQQFLQFAAQHFEVVVFTASQVCAYVLRISINYISTYIYPIYSIYICHMSSPDEIRTV
jgi:TFIIF-interacting CTD phosphatase-like protein